MEKPPGERQPKLVRWVGSSKEDLSEFPEEVRRRVGGALWEAQIVRKASYAKPLRGVGGAGALEIVDDFDGDTFRASTRFDFPRWFTCCMPFRKNRNTALPRLRPRST